MTRLFRTFLILGFLAVGLPLHYAVGQETDAESGTAERRDTERWREEMKRFAENDREILHRDVVFTGSSSIRMWKLERSFGDQFQWINRGFGGSIINDNLVYLEQTVFPYTPKVVVLYAGDNDIGIDMDVDSVVADYKRFCRKLRQELPDTKLIFVAIKPSLARWDRWPQMKEVNQRIQQLCNTSQWQWYADIASVMLDEDGKPVESLFLDDGLHMTDQGYERWTGVLQPLILEALGGPSDPSEGH